MSKNEPESPTIEPQIVMVKKVKRRTTVAEPSKSLTTKQAENRQNSLVEAMANLNDQEAALEAEISSIRDEHQRLNQSLRDAGQDRKKDILQIRQENPGISAKGLTDAILKHRKAKTTQLVENVMSLKDAMEVLAQQKTEVTLEIRRASAEIKDIQVDEQVKKVGDSFSVWLEAFKTAEQLFDDLKESVRLVDSPRFEQRFPSLGFPKSYPPVFDSFINQSNLNSLNMNQLSIMLADLGNAYGEPLLAKKMSRQEDVPMQRKEFLPSPSFGRV
jgi:predicted  nucleic acid-binding Zn-ribbon protein